MAEGGSGQDKAAQGLGGRCVLIVEDEYLLANDLEREFQRAGINIIGPVPSLSQATALIKKQAIDLAVLDIALSDSKVYAVADALSGRGVPVLFVTGYDRSDIPSRYSNVPRCQKPVGVGEVIAALEGIIAE